MPFGSGMNAARHRSWAARILAAALAAGVIATVAPAALHAHDVKAASRFKPDRIDIQYGEPKSPGNRAVHDLLKERKALEKVRDLLRPLRLPHRLLLQTTDCEGISNAFSNEENVAVCYEYIADILKSAPESTTPGGVTPVDAVIGPFLDVFLHEAGHSIFGALQIPLFGREEDAADQFSTTILLRFEKDEARRLILGSAYQYKGDLSAPTLTIAQQKFADEHGTPAQRFYNLVCVAYGADPKLFADVVSKGFLPEDRAIGCDREYQQATHAFNTLIGPYIDKRLARALHKRWLPPVTTRPKDWQKPGAAK